MILVMLAGCELNEEVIRNEKYAEKIKIRESSLDKLLGEGKFLTAYSKVYANRDKSRTAMEAQYNFTIVPHGAKVIEDGTKTSYTFKITREISNPDFFENLVINVDSLEQPSAYLLKYTPSEPSHPSSHNSFTFKGDIKLTPIVYDVSEMGKDIVCHTATIMMCNEPWTNGGSTEPHAATAQCNNPNHLFSVTTTTCDVVAGGGSMGAGAGQYTGGNNTGGQSGSGGGGDDTPTDGSSNPPSNCPRCPNIITVPVEDVASEEAPVQNPCVQLKNLLKQKFVKSGLNYLKNNLETNLETVYSLEYNKTDKSVSLRPGISGTRSGLVRVFPTTFASIHNHPVKTGDDESSFPMFSADDLLTPYEISLSNNSYSDSSFDYPVTNIMVVPDNTYALIPNNLQALSVLSAKFQNSESKTKFVNELKKIYRLKGDPWNVDQNTLAREFLKFVNEKYNLDISVYQISNNQLYSTNPTWSKIIIDPDNPTDIKKIPCN